MLISTIFLIKFEWYTNYVPCMFIHLKYSFVLFFLCPLLLLGQEDYSVEEYDSLVVVSFHQADYPQALIWAHKALKKARKTNADVATKIGCLNNIAVLQDYLGQYAASEKTYHKILALQKENIGKKDPNYALTLNNLAGLYYATGQYEQAEKLYLEVLEIRKKTLGTRHANYGLCLNNLAALYSAMKRYADAESMYKQANRVLQKALGEKHPDYAKGLNNLGMLY